MQHNRQASSLETTRWILKDVDGAPPQGMRAAELQLVDGRVAGSGGCNRLMGSYTIAGDRLEFGPLASTRMACPPPAMQLEDAVHRVLGANPAYSISGSILELTGGGVVLRYEAATDANQ